MFPDLVVSLLSIVSRFRLNLGENVSAAEGALRLSSSTGRKFTVSELANASAKTRWNGRRREIAKAKLTVCSDRDS